MKTLISRGLVLAALGAAALLELAGCSGPDTTVTAAAAANGPAGAVHLSLEAGDASLSSVTAVLSTASGEVQTHDIDVSGDNGIISIFIGELPEGSNYTIRLIAGDCIGTATFSVRANQTTLVGVTMSCPGDAADAGSPPPGTGSVQIIGHFPSADAGAPPSAACDHVADMTASPAIQAGSAPSTIDLLLKPGVEASSISWVVASTTGATGTLSGLEGAADTQVSLDCTADGTAYVVAHIVARASTGDCVQHARVAVHCQNQGSSQEVRCGDGVVNQASEECDGGELPDAGPAGTSCSADCKLVTTAVPRCGDGALNQASEECDGSQLPATAPAGSSCSADCKLVSAELPRCGDGKLNQDSEQCDGSVPASAPAGSTCSADCRLVAPQPPLPECGRCALDNCALQRADVDANAAAVEPILECVLGRNWKAGERAAASSCGSLDLLSCYCGTVSGQDCANAAPASLNGQCVAQVLTGTGCTVSSCVAPIFLNPANANGKAMQYAQCQQDFCYDVCFPL